VHLAAPCSISQSPLCLMGGGYHLVVLFRVHWCIASQWPRGRWRVLRQGERKAQCLEGAPFVGCPEFCIHVSKGDRVGRGASESLSSYMEHTPHAYKVSLEELLFQLFFSGDLVDNLIMGRLL
jgi:hypothetical protein